LPLALWASIWGVASKYIFAINRKHIFNPVAIAVVIVSLAINYSASWWIGTPAMLPIVILGGVLIIRKIRHVELFVSFFISALFSIAVLAFFKGSDSSNILNTLLITLKNSAFFFFAFVMLTEPLTSPTTKWLRISFGILVGFLFTPALHIGGFYSTPELALVIGNIFAYIVSPKEKLFLKLKKRIEVGTDTFDFIFENNEKINFKPGQYMEWTLKHRSPDTRGNRRYFTIASSPTEKEIHLGVKFYPEPSSFKNKLLALQIGDEIVAGQRSGDFVLPKNHQKELVFIAGGIGITPFRSMIKYLIDTNEKRNITLLYSNKKVTDISTATIKISYGATSITLQRLDEMNTNLYDNPNNPSNSIPSSDKTNKIKYIKSYYQSLFGAAGELYTIGDTFNKSTGSTCSTASTLPLGTSNFGNSIVTLSIVDSTNGVDESIKIRPVASSIDFGQFFKKADGTTFNFSS
jgi:hypothetical protein